MMFLATASPPSLTSPPHVPYLLSVPPCVYGFKAHPATFIEDSDLNKPCSLHLHLGCVDVVCKLILIPPRAWQVTWKPVVTRREVFRCY